MGFEVEDLDDVVGELRRRGVKIEEFDPPGLKTVNGIVEVAGNYPSKRSTGDATAKRTCSASVSRGAESTPSRSGPRGAPFSREQTDQTWVQQKTGR